MVYVAKSSQQGGAAKEALRERTIWSALPIAGCWVRLLMALVALMVALTAALGIVRN